MTDWIALIVAITGLVSAVLSGIAAIYAAKARRDTAIIKENVLKVEKATNSMKDELVKSVGDSQHALGMLAGRAAQKVESAESIL